jgi:hypothetical protein
MKQARHEEGKVPKAAPALSPGREQVDYGRAALRRKAGRMKLPGVGLMLCHESRLKQLRGWANKETRGGDGGADDQDGDRSRAASQTAFSASAGSSIIIWRPSHLPQY